MARSAVDAAWVAAWATVVLAAFAIVTAWLAALAFRKQSQEVSDQKSLISQQAEQLELQRKQFDEQRAVNARQAEVLVLQATELRASLDERRRQAEHAQRAQAEQVFLLEDRSDTGITARIHNTSERPIYEVRLSWHRGTAKWDGSDQLGSVRPGDQRAASRDLPDGLPGAVSRDVFGAVALFRDANGLSWRVRPDGRLDEMPADQPLP